MVRRMDALVEAATQLRAATAARDWVALGRIDRDIAVLLRGLRTGSPLSASENQAMAALAAVHNLARQSCAEESARLGQRLVEMCAYREGWMAYSLIEDDGQELGA